MKHTFIFIFKKAIIWAGMTFLALMIFSSQKIYATCVAGVPGGPSTNPPTEYCQDNSPWGCVGVAVYNCDYYTELPPYPGWGCYFHNYYCTDSGCASGAPAEPPASAEPGPEDCDVRGYKIPNTNPLISSQRVIAIGDGSDTDNPWHIDTGWAGTTDFTVTVPSGYTVEHNLCLQVYIRYPGPEDDFHWRTQALYKSADGYYHKDNVSGSYGQDQYAECHENAIKYSGSNARIYGCSGQNWNLYWYFTAAPSTGTVQGRKVIYPGYPTNDADYGLVEVEPAISQTVTLSGVGDLYTSPYWFNNVSAGSKTVSVTTPADYSVVSTLCYNRIGCHTDACAAGLPLCPEGDNRGCANDPICTGGAVSQSGASRTVDVPAGGWADLWWHYTPPSCSVILSPGFDSVEIGGTTTYTANVTPVPPSATVERVDFSSGNNGVATVNPASDSTIVDLYQTTARGESAGSTLINANVFMGGGSTCPDTATINVTNPDPWWQVDSGNIHANDGDVSSSIPSLATSPFLITGISGLVSYTEDLNLGDHFGVENINVTGNNWRAQTIYHGLETGYGYFESILGDDPQAFGVWSGGKPTSNGVFLGNGATGTTGGDWDVNSGDIYVILVPNDVTVTINNNINVDPGGFLAIISSGNITIGNAVTITNVEGVYIADGIISSGTANSQLIAEGIFVGWDGFNLQRYLANNSTTPAEKFIYRPDLVRNAYLYLKKPKIDWQEVAP